MDHPVLTAVKYLIFGSLLVSTYKSGQEAAFEEMNNKKRDDEIDELKRKLAILEGKVTY